MKRLWILFVTTLLISSCGFHPRGETTFSPALQRVYIKTQSPYGELAHDLHQYFTLSGIHLTDTAQDATTVFEVVSESTSQQLVGVTGTQQTRQYNLTLNVTFQLTDAKGTLLVPPETLSESRTLPISSGQILGGSNEATALFQQMHRAIVFDIINRISSQEISHMLIKQPVAP